jgi:glycosyltransferase involved in cell wall biosynthesis
MNILVVCSANAGFISPFVKEQVDSLKKQGIAIDVFGIKGEGRYGYLKNVPLLRKELRHKRYHLIHAHYGLSGLMANLQRKVPVVTTYHGSDVNLKKNVKYSKITAWLSSYNILTNEKLNHTLRLSNHFSIIPCGIDLDNFKPMDRNFCKQQMGLSLQKDYILFSSAYDREVKNARLAREAVAQLEDTELIELKGYSRKQVNLLINASRLLLMTSLHESAPQVVKEALACNCPVVSTDVGDVKAVLNDVQGSYLIDYTVEDVIQKCRFILENDETNKSREHVKKFELSVIANQIKDIYLEVLKDYQAYQVLET